MNVPLLACTGCGATKERPDGTPTDFYPSGRCGECPQWVCGTCGETSAVGALCPCWKPLDQMPFADAKAMFAGVGLSLEKEV